MNWFTKKTRLTLYLSLRFFPSILQYNVGTLPVCLERQPHVVDVLNEYVPKSYASYLDLSQTRSNIHPNVYLIAYMNHLWVKGRNFERLVKHLPSVPISYPSNYHYRLGSYPSSLSIRHEPYYNTAWQSTLKCITFTKYFPSDYNNIYIHILHLLYNFDSAIQIQTICVQEIDQTKFDSVYLLYFKRKYIY